MDSDQFGPVGARLFMGVWLKKGLTCTYENHSNPENGLTYEEMRAYGLSVGLLQD